jgi:hypothetical protein
MVHEEVNERLSRISTLWSMLTQAHAGPAEQASAACQALMQRYCGAVYRYLLGAVRDPAVADVAPDAPEPAAPRADSADSEHDFLNSWREELLERTWKVLAEVNPPYHAVLRLRVENAEMPSPQMAEQLTAQLGKALTAAWVRKTLQRAHDKYADLLLEEVAHSLPVATPEVLRQELQELDLLKYCRTALERRER